MSETGTAADGPSSLEWDLTDRLHKALRVGRCKPGEMARLLGVSGSTMTNYLNGYTKPKTGLLRQWAMRCGVPFEWLLTGQENDEAPGPDDRPRGRRKYPPRDSNPEPAD